MKRLSVALIGLFCLTPVALAEDPVPAESTPPEAGAELSLEERIKADPNNAELLNAYFGKNFRQVFSMVNSDVDAAEELLNEVVGLIEAIKPDQPEASLLLDRGKDAVSFYRERIVLARVTVESLVAKLKEKADDRETLDMYGSKIKQVLSPIARTESAKAEAQLNAAKKVLEDVSSRAEEDETKEVCEQVLQSFARLEEEIDLGKRLAALIGADAASLEGVTWVNGDPLTDGDLKGKVVLLDFWSVWCGPCISTFPHLRELQAKYAERGLVIIGLTRYYNFRWDDEAGRPTRSSEPVEPEAEQEMLKKFAELHNLQHRFAIQDGRGLSEFYVVSGIPHVVVIDREGKVQLVRVGAGGQTAHEIEEKIAELIGDG
jgi:thiol-disulfide isomerase/thioredoxin